MLLALAGSVVIAAGDRGGGSHILFGDLLAITGAMATSVYTLIGRSERKHMSTTAYTFVRAAFRCAADRLSAHGLSVDFLDDGLLYDAWTQCIQLGAEVHQRSFYLNGKAGRTDFCHPAGRPNYL